MTGEGGEASSGAGQALRVAPRAVFLTAIAMLAFAGNSLLCRLALGGGHIDAASFTTVRVVSGALLLGLLAWPGRERAGRMRFDWRAVVALSAYMACFSFAYLSLAAGTGALLLFGAVQLTMFAVALRAGERLSGWAWFGVALAVAGLCYLVAPGVTAPDPAGALLMTAAGVAWGAYSLRGRGNADPLRATATNFIGSIAIVAVVSVLSLRAYHANWQGLLLAATSGAVTSGLGYAAWYSALRQLTTARAATVQLSVPAIAALGGVVLLGEPLTARLVLASVATIGGIALVLARHKSD
jgi:drug/metabolite transporter (DMT)-like permease